MPAQRGRQQGDFRLGLLQATLAEKYLPSGSSLADGLCREGLGNGDQFDIRCIPSGAEAGIRDAIFYSCEVRCDVAHRVAHLIMPARRAFSESSIKSPRTAKDSRFTGSSPVGHLGVWSRSSSSSLARRMKEVDSSEGS